MDSQAGLHRLFPRAEIDSAVKRLASEITRDYHDKTPLLIGILKGSFMFLADLVRHLDFPLEIDFIRLSSYGGGRQTSGKVKVVQGLHAVVRGRHVLVIEDILDTGLTFNYLLKHVEAKYPASLNTYTLLDKPERRHADLKIFEPNFCGFTVRADAFVVGHGIDYEEKYRNYPHVAVVRIT